MGIRIARVKGKLIFLMYLLTSWQRSFEEELSIDILDAERE